MKDQNYNVCSTGTRELSEHTKRLNKLKLLVNKAKSIQDKDSEEYKDIYNTICDYTDKLKNDYLTELENLVNKYEDNKLNGVYDTKAA